MTKRLKSIKLWYVYTAVSAVIILAGIILYALLGFNTAAEKPAYKTFEVQYGVTAVLNEKEEEIQKICEDAFGAQNLKFTEKNVYDEIAGSSGSQTGSKRLVYTFDTSSADTALNAAKTAAEENLKFDGLEFEKTVTVNTVQMQTFTEASWRAAVGVATAAVAVLIYVGIRFGIGSALSGLVGVTNSVFFTLGFFAITRIPTYAFAPLLYAAIAAISTLFLWLLYCMKMRENFKNPEFKADSPEDAVAKSLSASDKFVFWTAGAIALVVLAVGLIASAGVRLLALPAIVAVAASVYSASLFAPSVHIHIKRRFDAIKEARQNKYAYKKKKKAEKSESARKAED